MKKIRMLLGLPLAIAALAFGAETIEEAQIKKVTYLGVHATPISPALTAQLELDDQVGLVVELVEKDSPADLAGLKQYDILLKLDDQILIGSRQFSTLVKNRKASEKVAVEYLRSGKPESLTVVLGERNDSRAKKFKWVGEGDFEMPGPHVFRFHGTDGVPHMDHEAMADWSKRLGENVEMVIENVYKGSQHPDFEKMPRVYLKRGNKMVQFKDDEASYDYSIGDGESLQIRDQNGNIVFSGSVESDEDLQTVPEQYRDRAKLMLKMEDHFDSKEAEL